MRRIAFLPVVIWLVLACLPARADAVSIAFGPSVVALNGPWKFHLGDDPRWAAQSYDDSRWEIVDLTPAPGAHDGDVGLKNYVSGWSARGHRGYAGFAWYRLKLAVSGAGDQPLWLVGPASVDNAYQVYVNGKLLGGTGDLSSTPPSIVAIQPRLFEVPPSWWTKDGHRLTALIAIRVAALKALAAAPDAGGVHIAPLLGTQTGAGDHFRFEWLQTIEGYAVDTIEPIAFLLLAVMALSLVPFERHDAFYPWLAAALVFLAAARGNQPLYFLAQVETFREFVFWRLAVVDALIFATWTMAWSACFGMRTRWMRNAVLILAPLYLIARVLGTSAIFASLSPATIQFFALLLQWVRYGFFALTVWIFVCGALRRAPLYWLALLTMLLGAIGLFAGELSKLGVPGIWFPYGVGVSRTEYAFAAFDVALFVYLLLRLWRHAPARVGAASAADS